MARPESAVARLERAPDERDEMVAERDWQIAEFDKLLATGRHCSSTSGSGGAAISF